MTKEITSTLPVPTTPLQAAWQWSLSSLYEQSWVKKLVTQKVPLSTQSNYCVTGSCIT